MRQTDTVGIDQTNSTNTNVVLTMYQALGISWEADNEL